MQANGATPVLTEKGDILKTHAIKPLEHPVDVTRLRVIAPFRWFVASPTAHKIYRDCAFSRGDQAGDHFSIKVGPGWIAVHQKNDVTVIRPLVQIVNLYIGTAVIGHREVVGLEREARQIRKSCLGCSRNLHRHSIRSFSWFGGFANNLTLILP